MNKNGPILVIEDDPDDEEFLVDIFKRLDYKNEILFFSDGHKALDYLIKSNKKPFLILSDINMPILHGFELRDKIHTNENLSLKCIPYLFFTTSTSEKDIIHAYSKSVQGFFIKPNTVGKLESTIKKIIEYWKECEAPNYERN